MRLFAHPGNPDARAAAVAAVRRRALASHSSTRLPLRRGSVVASGTVLGSVAFPQGARAGHIRFGIRPSGDAGSIDPGPILSSWAQLQTALHPQGAKAQDALLGATASDVFLMSKSALERAVLGDPGIRISACGRHDVASGAIDPRVLAVLAFLSRSDLKPTVGSLRCGQRLLTAAGLPTAAYRGDAVEISAINGTPVAGHQGTGTITDLTIRALLTLPQQFLPDSIVSLMRYPGIGATHASSSYSNRVRLEFPRAVPHALSAAAATAAAGKGSHKLAVPIVTTSTLTPSQWDQLIARAGAIAAPAIAHKPSSAAIPDRRRP
jgi:hypothetical protein